MTSYRKHLLRECVRLYIEISAEYGLTYNSKDKYMLFLNIRNNSSTLEISNKDLIDEIKFRTDELNEIRARI